MKPRVLLAAIVLAVLTAIPTMASAAFIHYFDCTDCHRDGAVWNSVDGSGVCITCHDTAGSTMPFPRTRPDDSATTGVIPPGFATGDASDAFGSGNVPLAQNSHNWGAADSNPAAGASPASSAMYSTRRGAAAGFVACYKCHDPHSYYDADYATGNETMLRTTIIGDGTSTNSEENVEAMCTECHLDWASVVSADRGFKSHPMDVADYETFAAGNDRFKSFTPPPVTADGKQMQLLTGNKIGCSTCHSVHGASSDGANDGKILNAPGASVDGLAICTSCHEQMAHPSSTGPGTEIGCLVCHSGHSYNDGTPNYFILRSEVTVPAGVSLSTAGTTITGLRYETIPATGAEIAQLYVGIGGDDGYCTGCHGLITATGPGEPSEIQTHTGAEDCSQCHAHLDPANPDNSFTGKGCTGCHGYPPTQNIAGGDPNAGYASDPGGTTFDYNTNNGAATYLLEASTPHGTHAASNPIATNIDCKTCHNAHVADFNAQHNNSVTGQTFQNVLEGAYAFSAQADAGGILLPNYTGGTTTCAAVYCHSNGGAYNATGKVLADYTTTSVSWDNTNGTISDCSSCHDDNTSGIGGAGPKNNSPAHAAHVTRYDAVGSSCNLCHFQTTNGSTIDSPANHVDGTVQFATDSAFVIDTVSGATLGGSAGGAGSCAVYCHSDGNGIFSDPAWDDGSAAGACGACHSIAPAVLGGAHVIHLTDPAGPQLAGSCNTCHTHDGSFTANNGHIDKSVLPKVDACDACHGKPGGGWTLADTVDEAPVWTDPTTVRCDTCHSGTVAVINAVSAPLVAETAYANGHGKGGVAQSCTDCHEANTVTDHLGGATIDRTIVALGYAADDDRAFCNACHATTVFNHNVNDGTVCKTCHAQHGEANGFDAMIKSTVATHGVTGFTAQGVRSSYVNAGFTGICQACHNTTTTKYFSPNKYEDLTHNPGQACSDCHAHESTPGFTGAGDSCDACHGYPPATAAHAVHAPDSFTADAGGKVYRDGTNGFADVSACVGCHTGADLYTYSPSDDQASGNTDRDNHNAGNANQVATLLATVGYTDADGSCATACHLADNTRADWAGGFTFPAACDACHDNPPATGGFDDTAHVDHISAGLNCGSCHNSNPADTAHIDTYTGADELAKVQSMTTALAANVTVDEASWVANADRTCSTSVCHNPSPGAAYAANWDTSTSSCTLCHSDTDPATASHDEHLGALAQFKVAIDCTSCHGDTTSGGADTGHRSTTVEMAGGITYTGDQTDFTIGTWGTCSTTTCHNDGLGVAAVSPTWGTASADCTICHTEPPTGGSHPSHTAVSVACTQCHDSVVTGTTAPTNHLDNDVDVYDTAAGDLGYPVNAALGSASWASCNTLVCHNDGQGTANGTTAASAVVTPVWGNNAASCGQCHAASPVSAKHDEHLGSYGSTCGDCHANVTDGSTLPTADHIDGDIDVLASLNYSLYAVGGMAPADGWGTCTNPNTGCHGTPEARLWDGAVATCDSCHGASSTGTGEPLIVGDMISTNPLGQHDTHVNTKSYGCAICHTGGHFPSLGDQDDTLQISFTGLGTGGTYDPPGTWTVGKWLYTQASVSATQDCSNVYCHSSGQPDGGGIAAPTYTTPDWGSAATGACGTCHSETDPATGAHTAHIDGFVTLDCTTCHSGNTHVNQAVEVSTGTYTSAGAVGNGYGTCSNASCHQTGQTANDLVVTPNWGTDDPNCTTCHAATPLTGSHVAHVVTDGSDCSACHTGATKDTSYIVAAHLDGNVDVAVGTYTINKAYGAVVESCSGVSCHDDGRNGGNTQDWGTTLNNCSECHATQPATGGHTAHIGVNFAGAAISCADCHTGTTEGVTAPAGHRDGNVDVDAGSYPANKLLGSAFTSCSTASCHRAGQDPIAVNDYTVTANWDVDNANCTQCHAATPATGSHATHVTTAGYDCSQCHTGATKDTSYAAAAHGDSNIDVAVGDYIINRTNQTYGTAFTSCDTIACHGDGLNAGGGNTPLWGASAGCAACHDTVTDGTGSHAIHLTYTSNACIACHDNADVTGTAPGQHGDGNIDVFDSLAGDLGYPINQAIGSITWTGCTAASCHDDGRSANTTPNWGTAAGDACAACHDAIPATGSHASHVADAAVACTDCHSGAVESTTKPTLGHDDGNIDTTVGHGYTQDKLKGSAFTTCATASCHNDGRNSGLTDTWGATINNCAECHATQPATGSHATHLALYACADCHTGVTEATTAGPGHRDGNIDVDAATGLATNKVLGSAFTSCGTNNCHGSGSPVWGVDLSTNDQCTQCHGQLVVGPATDSQKAPGGLGVDTNGDSLATDAQVGAHQVHLNPSLSAPIACASCHVVPGTVTAAGHIDSALPAELTWSGIATANSTIPISCATTYCHDGSAIKNGWDGGTLAPTWINTAFIGGTQADCDNCHGFPPPATHPANADCKVCHDNTNATNDGFTDVSLHVNGTVEGGGDTCTDCHNAGDIDGALNGVHNSHVNVATFLGAKSMTTGDYGANGWWSTTYTAGIPSFGCGMCHPADETASHPANGLNVNLDPGQVGAVGSIKTMFAAEDLTGITSRVSASCSTVYCHSDAAGTFQDTLATIGDWYAGTGQMTGNCNECHGNSPTTNAHGLHEVGIHYEELYSGTVGTLAATGIVGSGAGHGDSVVSSTITCYTCHSGTVTDTANAGNSTCSSCHSDSDNIATGDELARILSGSSTHINGAKDVVFADMTAFKSRAQLRDNLADADDGTNLLSEIWNRITGYKGATDRDEPQAAFDTPTFGAGTCSTVACHNGNSATWTDSGMDCMYCHTSLPK